MNSASLLDNTWRVFEDTTMSSVGFFPLMTIELSFCDSNLLPRHGLGWGDAVADIRQQSCFMKVRSSEDLRDARLPKYEKVKPKLQNVPYALELNSRSSCRVRQCYHDHNKCLSTM